MQQWIAEARQGSPEALGRALETCRQYLLLVANERLNPLLRCKVGASDVVQETFLEAQRDFRQFGGGTEAELLAWLRHILLNNLANLDRHYRGTAQRQVDREVSMSSALFHTESPSGPAQAREQTEELDRALAQLPEHYRQVIALRHEQGLAFDAVGEQLGRSAEAARKLWTRAVEHLQQILESPHEP